jgi:hypothetical protein
MKNSSLAGLVMIPGLLWNGFIISKLWLWFVVPSFGLPIISVATAMGLHLLVEIFIFRKSDAELAVRTGDKIADKDDVMASILFNFGAPAMLLGLGWLCTFLT